jgi:hypothetical protein
MKAVFATRCLAVVLLSRAVFSDYRAQSAENISWGTSSNGLSAGLWLSEPVIRLDTKTGNLITRAAFAIKNTSTNRVRFFWPPLGARDRISIVDKAGSELPKAPGSQHTSKQPRSATPVRFWKRGGYMPYALEAGEEYVYDFVVDRTKSDLNIGKCFTLTNPGAYNLVLKAAIALADENGFLKIIELPTVSVPLQAE